MNLIFFNLKGELYAIQCPAKLAMNEMNSKDLKVPINSEKHNSVFILDYFASKQTTIFRVFRLILLHGADYPLNGD